MLYDVIFIGGGFRTVSFLLADYRLLKLNLCIVESSHQIGPGKFNDLDCLSNSNGATFLRHLDAKSRIANNDLIKLVGARRSPLSLSVIGKMLKVFGDEIAAQLPFGSVITDHKVFSIDLRPTEPYPVHIQLAGREGIRGKICVLGTGQSETIREELLKWKERVFLSGRFLSITERPRILNKLKENRNSNIILIGCSHGVFACTRLLCDLMADIGNHDFRVTILHRRKVRIYYANVEEAQRSQNLRFEENFGLDSICQETGEVFKDSGIKHEAKAMFRSICEGNHHFIQMQLIDNLHSCSTIFDESNLIIQATGLHSVLPTITLNGDLINRANDTGNLITDAYGILSHQTVDMKGLIAQLRVIMTPEIFKDKIIYNKELYKNLTEHLLYKFTTDI